MAVRDFPCDVCGAAVGDACTDGGRRVKAHDSRTAAQDMAQAVNPNAITEARFQTQVLELAAAMGWKAYHTRDSRGSAPGFPDLVLTDGRRVIFAELKTERGKPTADQLAWLSDLEHAQAVDAYLWRPSDWNDIAAILGAGG